MNLNLARFSLLLKTHRKITLVECSGRLKIGVGTAWSWENLDNPRLPKEKKLPQIAKVYNIPLEVVIREWQASKKEQKEIRERNRGVRNSFKERKHTEAQMFFRRRINRWNFGP